MSELKPCPFCGRQPYESGGYVSCHTELCLANADYHEPAIGPITDWNNRPIEDALTARIAELEAENDRLQDAWFLDETICPDGSTRPTVSQLLSRIAELGAENNRLAELLHNELSSVEIATDLGNKRWVALNDIY